jgi:ribosome-associated protein
MPIAHPTTPMPPMPPIPTPHSRNDAARGFAIDAARLAANTRCHNVVLLDVRGISPVTDYMIVATGTSPRQMRTVCDEIAELGEKVGYSPLASNGMEGETWMLIDCVDVVVHVFSQDARQFYDLDNLWGDAAKVEWNAQPV